MNIVSVTVSAAMMGTLMPGIMTMAIAPSVAQVRANNFAVAEAQTVAFAANANVAYELPEVPDNCEVNEKLTEISCVEGNGKYAMIAKRSFQLLDAGAAGNLGVYYDNDGDGFDDVTGLPTHYWECYSGWKGVGTLKNNCQLGGKYVIPAYSSIYN